ncbi:nucleoporin Nup43 [Anopheles cruzii]|uniref:nucleoporin Nup43 n=1 Tax=Anopheles cruzii TaxID=68878 RepID=UPI0022EC2A48|nr:nucleoporin Nup43 [Anopheles cruzii]
MNSKAKIGNQIQCSAVPRMFSRLRWLPEHSAADLFVAGSWADYVNSVSLFKCSRDPSCEDGMQIVPELIAEIPFYGDVTGLEILDEGVGDTTQPQQLACSTSEGYIHLLGVEREMDRDNLQPLHQYETRHKFGESNAACTGLSVYGARLLATAGEDGLLHIIDKSRDLVRSYDEGNECSFRCVEFTSSTDVLASSSIGGIKSYDIRASPNKPSFELVTDIAEEKENVVATCISHYPNKPQFVFAGLSNGMIKVWDLRMKNHWPISMKGHSSTVNDIAFAKHDASIMFSASEDGEILQWSVNNSVLTSEPDLARIVRQQPPLLNERRAINSLDTNRTQLLAGGDCHMVYLVDTISK